MLVLGRDIVYDRSTACAFDVSCEQNRFPKEVAKYPSSVPFVLKSKSTNNQYCITVPCSLETVGDLTIIVQALIVDSASTKRLLIDRIVCGSLDRRWPEKLLLEKFE